MFIGDEYGYLTQWNIPQQKLIKHYGQAHLYSINCLLATSDNDGNKYLFTSDSGGHLIQWDILNQNLVRYYGQAHSSSICSIIATS